MSGAKTHINVAAYHEAGPALAALREGRQVRGIFVSTKNPGNGLSVNAGKLKNPHDLTNNLGSAKAAWTHTYETTRSEIRILLAGPLAEAKALGKPLRSLGSRSDLWKCMYLASRLVCLNTYALQFVDLPPIDREEIRV